MLQAGDQQLRRHRAGDIITQIDEAEPGVLPPARVRLATLHVIGQLEPGSYVLTATPTTAGIYIVRVEEGGEEGDVQVVSETPIATTPGAPIAPVVTPVTIDAGAVAIQPAALAFGVNHEPVDVLV